MKNILFAIIFTLLIATPVVAQTKAVATPTPGKASPTVTPTPKDAKLEDLKERLATKVAELRQLTKRAIFGTVKTTSVSTFTVETKASDVKIELTDDIKVIQFIKGKRTTLTTDDIAKGDTVVVFGDYDTGLELLQAKVVFIQGALPVRISGVVTATDAKAFTVTIKTKEGQPYIVDVEKTTTALGWTKEKGVVKSGFSQIAVGDMVHVLGTPVAKKENQLTGIRILSLGNLSGVTPTATPEPTDTPTPTEKPTSKVTPTKATSTTTTTKTTPTAKTTPKATPTP